MVEVEYPKVTIRVDGVGQDWTIREAHSITSVKRNDVPIGSGPVTDLVGEAEFEYSTSAVPDRANSIQ